MPAEQVLLIIPKLVAVTPAWYKLLKTLSVMSSEVEEDEIINSSFPLAKPFFLPALGIMNLTLVA